MAAIYEYDNGELIPLGGGSGGSGGHTIVDTSGTSLSQRSNLKFTGGVSVTDDSTNDATIVEVEDAEEITYAAYSALTPVQQAAKQYLITDYPSSGGSATCVKVALSSVTSLPITSSNANITSSMEVISSVLSNPSAQSGDWTVTTSTGSVTISGTINGTTDITMYLMPVL